MVIKWLHYLSNTWCQYISKDETLEKEFPVHSLRGRGCGPTLHDLISQDVPPLPGGCLSTRRRRVPCGRSSVCTGHCPSVRDLPSFSPQWPPASEPAGLETCCPLRPGSSSKSALSWPPSASQTSFYQIPCQSWTIRRGHHRGPVQNSCPTAEVEPVLWFRLRREP